MSLDLHFFKKGTNFQGIRESISVLYEKKRTIDSEIEQLENDYDYAKLTSLNITHNLNKMAMEAGIYEVLWYPETIGITSAFQMIQPLESGLRKLKSNPEKYKSFNPSNGWGKYEDLVNFCESALYWCREYPDAIIEASA